ncbi:hypothetical protein RRG08_054899 [Elysia crispata]|uniref:Uncharacterized protein n=1 Tax=Elysia crispata TaxID=231223 RepID=A0AAE1DTB4_9GAST|nr:hypothetical protein RRG08_054899 [Elysia crispata]
MKQRQVKEAESLSRQASPSATVIQYGALVCRLGYPPSAVRLVALARWRHARIRLLSKAGSSREAQGPNAKEVFSNLGEQFQELATGRTLDKVWLSFLGADKIVEVRAGDLGGFWWDSSEKVEREEGDSPPHHFHQSILTPGNSRAEGHLIPLVLAVPGSQHLMSK